MILAPSHLSPGHEIFYVSTKQTVKVFMARNAQIVGDKITLATAAMEFKEHVKGTPRLIVSASGECLLTYATDGFITARSMIEPEKFVKVYSHDVTQGGVTHASFSRECRHVISIGSDLIFRRSDWKFTTAGRRAALEATESIEAFVVENIEEADKVTALLIANGEVLNL
jgi:cilia- and flagella-associated protein 43